MSESDCKKPDARVLDVVVATGELKKKNTSTQAERYYFFLNFSSWVYKGKSSRKLENKKGTWTKTKDRAVSDVTKDGGCNIK